MHPALLNISASCAYYVHMFTILINNFLKAPDLPPSPLRPSRTLQFSLKNSALKGCQEWTNLLFRSAVNLLCPEPKQPMLHSMQPKSSLASSTIAAPVYRRFALCRTGSRTNRAASFTQPAISSTSFHIFKAIVDRKPGRCGWRQPRLTCRGAECPLQHSYNRRNRHGLWKNVSTGQESPSNVRGPAHPAYRRTFILS